MTLEFSQQIFEKYSYVKFNENSSNGSRIVPCGRTDRRTDMTKLIVAFRNFANAIYCSAEISKLNLLVTGNWKFEK